MSLTYIGIIVSLLSYLAKWLDINVAPGDLDTTVTTVVALGGALVAFYGRYRKGDISMLGVKKKVGTE